MSTFTPITNPKPLEWVGGDAPTATIAALRSSDTLNKVAEAMRTHNIVSEKIIGPNNMQSISLLLKISRMANAVCLIQRRDGARGTGFLIADNLLMTNWHVLDTIQETQGAIARFNYQQDESGTFL